MSMRDDPRSSGRGRAAWTAAATALAVAPEIGDDITAVVEGSPLKALMPSSTRGYLSGFVRPRPASRATRFLVILRCLGLLPAEIANCGTAISPRLSRLFAGGPQVPQPREIDSTESPGRSDPAPIRALRSRRQKDAGGLLRPGTKRSSDGRRRSGCGQDGRPFRQSAFGRSTAPKCRRPLMARRAVRQTNKPASHDDGVTIPGLRA